MVPAASAPADSARMVFEDRHIRVIHHPGLSDDLLVTFGDGVTLAEGLRFAVEPPVRKARLSCLGFMAKAKNWYPQRSVAAAVAALRPLLSRYPSRVLHGGSMGGYAAIKYSCLLRAEVVIAFCPQWSIDPADCGTNSLSRAQSFVAEVNGGMAIRRDDVVGEIFMFVDASHREDMFHARAIQAAFPPARIINVPFVGHHVTSIFAGTDMLLRLIGACRAGREDVLRELGRQARLHHKYRIRTTLPQAMERHPLSAMRIAGARAAADVQARGFASDHLFALIDGAMRQGRAGDAVTFISGMQPHLRDVRMQAVLALLHEELTRQPLRMVTHHGSTLVYSLADGRCRHVMGLARDNPLQRPVRLRLQGGGVQLYARIGATVVDLVVDDAGRLVDMAANAVGRVELAAGRAGTFALKAAGKFFCAEADGSLVLNRPQAGNWEFFRFYE